MKESTGIKVTTSMLYLQSCDASILKCE